MHVFLRTLVLDTLPSPASEAMSCPLSPTLFCSHVMVRQAVGWAYGYSSGMCVTWLPPWLIGWMGERQGVCFLSMSASSHGIHWHGFLPSSHHPQGIWGSPLSMHHLKPTQNWLDLGKVVGDYIKRIPGYFPWETTAYPDITIKVMDFHHVILTSKTQYCVSGHLF